MPGTVLLLAAAPLGRGRLVDAAGVLPVLAAVAPAVLSGTDTANVVELADPLEPQAVLTRLRAAAAAPGPLTVYLTGQLHLDRRQHLLHLALARTTPATVRYTALPWQWIREELRLRSAADTALVVDLHADAESWRHVTERGLDCGRNITVYGRVAAAAAGRRGPAEPAYMKTVATLLRSGHRPPLDALHQQALARVPEETAGNLLLAHTGGYTPGFPTAGGFAPVAGAAGPVRSPGAGGFGAGGGAVPSPGAGGPGGAPSPSAGAGGFDVSGGAAASSGAGGHAVTSVGVGVGVGAVGGGAGSPVAESAAGFRGGDLVPAPRPADPHAAISAAVQSGRHPEADAIAARYQEDAVRAHGAGSEPALHWSEVRADLAMFAGDPVRSCRVWLAVAEARLAAGQAVDAPAVEAAVDRAHHQWATIKDAARARELGPALAQLRLRVPGRRRGALENVQRQLGRLQAAR
ncbi:hypothetical protein [Streptomyces sp. Caat 7-52]|uniref:hypothetical protein n=1 Tax=Streptomyces sp. Caat 7-52 TaxID=2949637 RepID=UPI002035D2A7|nr:hypothetical protein [Streptomyces sp. Caat 7-52]